MKPGMKPLHGGIRYAKFTVCNALVYDSDPYTVSQLGRSLINEMNRLGVLVDLSHTSDATAVQALSYSKAPVIWSHSSARAVHDVPRNIPDDILRLIGTGGGQKDAVVMVCCCCFQAEFHADSPFRRLTLHLISLPLTEMLMFTLSPTTLNILPILLENNSTSAFTAVKDSLPILVHPLVSESEAILTVSGKAHEDWRTYPNIRRW